MFPSQAASCNLTLVDCDLVLKKYFEDDEKTVKAIGFKVSPIAAIISGYLGKHLILDIRYTNENASIKKVKFFLKSTTDLANPYASYFPELHHKESGMYEIMETYNLVCGHLLQLNTAPKLYLNHVKSETMVMENLSLQGFRMHDTQKKVMDVPHMLVALNSLAKFHAASIIYEETKTAKLGQRFRLPEEFGHCLEEIAFSRHNVNSYNYAISALKGLHALVDLIPLDNRISAGEFKGQLTNAVNKLFDHTEGTETYRCVWSHADLWTRNMLYSYDQSNNPIDCKFVDYQLVRYAPPAMDVTMLIYHTLDKETYKKHYDMFLNNYYDCLMKYLDQAHINGSDVYTRECFLKSCKEYLLSTKMMLAIWRTLTAADEETYWNLAKDLKAFEHVLVEDRSEYVKQNFEKNENYAKHLSEILEDIKETILEELVRKLEEADFY